MSGQQLPHDPVDAALEAVKRLDRVLRSNCSRDGGLDAESIATRARQLPQLILQSGLTPTLAFILSKLDNEKKRIAYSILLRTIMMGEDATGDGGNICEDLGGEGYPQIAALAMAYAATAAGCDSNSVGRFDSNLIGCLERIKDGGVILEKLMLTYSEEVKKLATAFYSKE